jgi:hypothetical protein
MPEGEERCGIECGGKTTAPDGDGPGISSEKGAVGWASLRCMYREDGGLAAVAGASTAWDLAKGHMMPRWTLMVRISRVAVILAFMIFVFIILDMDPVRAEGDCLANAWAAARS